MAKRKLKPHPRWKDDPFGGVDVSVMRELLKLTPAERLRWAVESANNVAHVVSQARQSLRRK